jgi:hypothetical protein
MMLHDAMRRTRVLKSSMLMFSVPTPSKVFYQVVVPLLPTIE